MGQLQDSISCARPDEDTIWTFAKAFGSYVGEVFRKHHGGVWGMVTKDGQSFPGFRSKGGAVFWPWDRVFKRIVLGPENNVFHYYRSLVKGEARGRLKLVDPRVK